MTNKKINFYILFIVLFFFSSFLIFYKFTLIPSNLSFDEVDFAKLAMSLDGKPYQVYSSLATGHSTLYFYILLGSMKVFGINSFALRLPSAIFGIINVLLIFLIMKRVFKNNFIAFATACIFLTMRWYFNFARFSFEATFLLLLELSSIYFLLRFGESIKNKKMTDLILCALFAGLAFHSYYPGRIFFILPALWILIHTSKKYFIWFILILGIIAAPLLLHNIIHPDVRVSQISFLSDPKIPVDYKLKGIITNIGNTILMPFWKGDMNGRHNFPGKPALNPILGLLFLFGILVSFSSRSIVKQDRGRESINSAFFFLTYLIISITPTLLTSPNDNPNMLRTFTAIPAVIYFVGLSIDQMYQQVKKTKYKHVFIPLLFFFILLSSFYELRTYFAFQSRVFRNSFEVTCELKDVVNKPIIPKSCRVHGYMF